jgi:ribosomal protein S6
VKRYEGLFILDTAGKEEGIKDMIDRITAELNGAGAKVETVQKLDKRSFARVADRRHTSGFYVNVIFGAEPAVAATVQQKFTLNSDVFRLLVTEAAPIKDAATA